MSARKVARFGWIRDLPDHRDRHFNLEREILTDAQLPSSASLRSQMPAVYDQGQLGSCTGNGVAGVLERAEMQKGEGANTPSRLFIYYGERVIEGTVGEDSGAQIRDGIKVVASEGAPPETDWPYDISKFTEKPPLSAYEAAKHYEALQYLRITPGGAGEPIRTAVAQGYPVVFGFSVPEYFESGWGPVASSPLPLPSQSTSIIGGHCTVVVGYDFSLARFPVPVYEIRNSWGEGWGDAGHFWMDSRWLDEPERGLSSDFWVIEEVS